MKRLILYLTICISSISAFGQNTQIRAVVDTNIIEFANQTVLRLQVQTDGNSNISFPVFDDTISKNIEIVEQYPVDTINKSPLTFEKAFLITSFEDSLQTIPALPVIINQDTLFTNPVNIFVIPFHIDSAEVAKIDTSQIIPIFDIKPPIDTPLTFKEFWLRYGKIIIILLIIIALIPFAIWLIKKLKSDEPLKILQKPKEPAHVIALRRLKSLKESELHKQDDKVKEFYSELTDIVRTYIEQRYDIPALERTSTEILDDFEKGRVLNSKLFNELRKLLNLADLAKFAKYMPSFDVNNGNLEMAFNFVEETKQIIQNLDNENITSQNSSINDDSEMKNNSTDDTQKEVNNSSNDDNNSTDQTKHL